MLFTASFSLLNVSSLNDDHDHYISGSNVSQKKMDNNSFKDYIYVAGRNGSGQLGIRNLFSKIKIPKKINFNFKIKLIKCGFYTTIIVSENNEIFIAGKCRFYNYEIFTKVNCKNFDVKIKNVFFSLNDEVFIATDCNEIYTLVKNNDKIELQKLEYKEVKNISIISFYSTSFYFVTKTNDLYKENVGPKILTFRSKVKEIYINLHYYFGINEFDNLLMYDNVSNFYCYDILQSLQNKQIEKISVGSSCLVFTKTKELFYFENISSFKTFTKIELKPEIIENIIDVKVGLYNKILILKGNQFYIKGNTFIFGEFSEYTKLDMPTIDSSVNSVENEGNFFIFYRNYKKENETQLKLKQILMNQKLVDLRIVI